MVRVLEPFIREHLPIPEGAGVKVTRVMAGTPAAMAGIRKNDILVSANQQQVGSLERLKKEVVSAGEKGVDLKLEVIRKGKSMSVSIKPEDRRAPGREPRMVRPDAEFAMDRRFERMQQRLDRQDAEIGKLRRLLRKLMAEREER